MTWDWVDTAVGGIVTALGVFVGAVASQRTPTKPKRPTCSYGGCYGKADPECVGELCMHHCRFECGKRCHP